MKYIQSLQDSKFLAQYSIFLIKEETYLSSSHGFNPVCFLNAAEKCEIEE